MSLPLLLRRAAVATPPSGGGLWAAIASLRAHLSTTASGPETDRYAHPPAPTHAIVRGVSRGFKDAISMASAGEAASIDAEKAAEQHRRYVETLLSASASRAASAASAAAPPGRRRPPAPPLRLIELDAPDDLPDACFVEDTAVVVPGSWLPPGEGGARLPSLAVVARPPAPARAGEVAAVRAALRRLEASGGTEAAAAAAGAAPAGSPSPAPQPAAVRVLGEIAAPGALDGGDVLILPPAGDPDVGGAGGGGGGRPSLVVLVGLSERTNAQGAAQLRDLLAPHGVQVVAVPVAAALARLPPAAGGDRAPPPAAAHPPPSRPLHLKSAVTALSSRVLVCADGLAGRAIAAAVHGALLRARPPPLPPAPPSMSGGGGASAAAPAAAPGLPTFAFLPEGDACAANVLLLGEAVVAQPASEASERVLRFLCEREGRRLVLVDPPLDELKKADGALTCCSILF